MLRALLEQDLVDRHAGDALTQHQTHHFQPQTGLKQQPSPFKGQPAQKTAMQEQQQRGRHQEQEASKLSTQGHDKLTRQQDGRRNAASKRVPASRPKIWMR